MSVKIYVEGGGDAKALKRKCREGFSTLLAKAGFEGRMPSIVACGGRNDAYDSFKTALRAQLKTNVTPILLVDSEGAFVIGADIWAYLDARDGWSRPTGCSDDDVHLMVQCMESWLIADPNALAEHFGKGFNKGSLPKHAQPEQLDKPRLIPAIEKAIRQCAKKRYDKGSDSFAILARCDPAELRTKMPFFNRLCERLEALL